MLRLSLTEFCLPKFHRLFGISNVKSAADTAFQSTGFQHFDGENLKFDFLAINFLDTHTEDDCICPVAHSSEAHDSILEEDMEVVILSYVDMVTDALLEIMEVDILFAIHLAKAIEEVNIVSQFNSQYLYLDYLRPVEKTLSIVSGCKYGIVSAINSPFSTIHLSRQGHW